MLQRYGSVVAEVMDQVGIVLWMVLRTVVGLVAGRKLYSRQEWKVK